MALIVITVIDGPAGADVSVVSEPALDGAKPQTLLTAAQAAALTMLQALQGEIKQDRGLIQLLS